MFGRDYSDDKASFPANRSDTVPCSVPKVSIDRRTRPSPGSFTSPSTPTRAFYLRLGRLLAAWQTDWSNRNRNRSCKAPQRKPYRNDHQSGFAFVCTRFADEITVRLPSIFRGAVLITMRYIYTIYR